MIFLVVALVELTLRVATRLAVPEFDYKTHAFATHLRLDSLLCGSLLAYYSVFAPEKLSFVRRYRAAVFVGSLLLLCPPLFAQQSNFWIGTVGYTGLYLGGGGLLLVFLTVPVAESRWFGPPGRVLASVGSYSYSIYLWHIPVIAVGVALLDKVAGRSLGAGVGIVAYFVASVGGGMIMARAIEFPALRLRDRLFPPPTKPAVAGETGSPFPDAALPVSHSGDGKAEI
jgi:peptidoglycan/LPS O-acetylase OafA/YrhL